jgi:hypothetical protein
MSDEEIDHRINSALGKPVGGPAETDLQVTIGIKDGLVFLDFGRPIVCFGMAPGLALEVSYLLSKHVASVLNHG